MNIRLLRADEIDVRVQTVKDNGYSLLLYKDARVDMTILDETFGIYGWKRKHDLINGNLFCTISIYNPETQEWIDKQDVGTESNAEKEKGQASDSFKRAAFNIGIGRELYTAPFIWISTDKRTSGKEKLKVSEIEYNDNREISHLIITDNKGNVKYKLGSYAKASASKKTESSSKNDSTKNSKKNDGISDAQVKRLYAIAYSKLLDADTIKNHVKTRYNKEIKDLTKAEYDHICEGYEKMEIK